MSIARNAGKMGIATFFSRILGLVREQVFAFFFGASDAADAFNIAFRIPNLLRDLFAEGAMSAAFVPNFVRAIEKEKAEGRKDLAFSLLVALLSILFIGLSILSVIGIVFSSYLVDAFAHAFREVPGKFELATQLTQIIFPFFPLVAMAAVIMGALNALGSFFLPAFAPVLFNLASIICGLVLTPIFSQMVGVPPIYSMAIGTVLGGFLQFYIQWWKIKKLGLKLKLYKQALLHPWSTPGVKDVLVLLIPGTVGLAAAQLNVLINSIYATSQGTGAVSWLYYAFRLMQFPIGIFGVSLAAATLPLISRSLALGNQSAASADLASSLRLTYAINAPAAAGLVALGLPIIQLIYQHGNFTAADAEFTAQALFWYALGLPAYSIVKVVVPVFYALRSSRIPVMISFFTVGLNAALCHVFLNIYQFSFWALALSTSITISLNAVILLVILQKSLKNLLSFRLGFNFFSHTALAAAVGYSALFLSKTLKNHFESSMSGVSLWGLQVFMAMFGAIFVWLILGKLLKIREINIVTDRLTQIAEKKLGLGGKKGSQN